MNKTSENRAFSTGAQRDGNKNKGRYDLIPPEALRRVALRYQNGAVVYGERNWEKGMPLSQFLDSAIRHCYAILQGDFSEDHAAAAAWNLCSFMATQERIDLGQLPSKLDNLPHSLPL